MLLKHKDNKRVIIIWAILAILIIATGVFWWTNQTPFISNVEKFDTMKKDFPTKNADSKQKKQSTPSKNTVKAIANSKDEIIAEIASFSAGNFGKLNALRGQVDVLEIELEIAGLKAKKSEIQGRNTISQNENLPAIVAPVKLTDLALPTMPTMPIITVMPKPKPLPIAVVEISGIGSNLFALIRLRNNKIVKVSQGQRFNSGIIKEISRKNVIVQYGRQKTVILPFE